MVEKEGYGWKGPEKGPCYQQRVEPLPYSYGYVVVSQKVPLGLQAFKEARKLLFLLRPDLAPGLVHGLGVPHGELFEFFFALGTLFLLFLLFLLLLEFALELLKVLVAHLVQEYAYHVLFEEEVLDAALLKELLGLEAEELYEGLYLLLRDPPGDGHLLYPSQEELGRHRLEFLETLGQGLLVQIKTLLVYIEL